MASTSAPRGGAAAARIKSAATTLFSDNQSTVSEIRKAFSMMKDIAIDLERANQSQKVKELEDAVIQLLEASEDCMHLSSAVQAIGNGYEPGEQPTNFSKLFEDEITKSKASSSSVPQNHTLLRQFREAIWNVHHAGQPMPGEEQEDIVMTSTQCNILNNACPVSGRAVTELADPVRRTVQQVLVGPQYLLNQLFQKLKTLAFVWFMDVMRKTVKEKKNSPRIGTFQIEKKL
ncbi:hypothetical protein RJ639_024995 [Escallonia herrerae]|uniref:Uncharacterized protein n=1 Tax=Escallonia herrerae TaxID=1293975 RepID=A0AA88RW61_9ASTE|nr:hypothetical protein RJ639_024995 [Escallonia herrerae]